MMIKKSVVVLKFMWFILFSAFVFLQNHILFLEKMNNTGLYISHKRDYIKCSVFFLRSFDFEWKYINKNFIKEILKKI